MPLWGLAIGAAVGIVKSETVDKKAADQKRKYETQVAKYAPWTGMKSENVPAPNDFNAALQFGATGAQVGAAIKSNQADTDKTKAQTAQLEAANKATDSLGKPMPDATLPQGSADPLHGPQLKQMESPPLAAGTKPAWFYGNNPSPNASPMGAPPQIAGGDAYSNGPYGKSLIQDPNAPYKDMMALGIDANAPYQSRGGPWGWG